MAERVGLIEIRTFQSWNEIQALPGFKEDNLVHKDNYAALVGDYELDEDVSCCMKNRAGGFCKRKHGWGFVVQLKDGTSSVVGNVCGNGTFDAESTLVKDKARYRNLKERQGNQRRIAELLQGKDEARAKIVDMRTRLLGLAALVEKQLAEFGPGCASQLRSLARGASGRVVVMGVRVRPYEEDGRTRTETDRFHIPVGTLSGLRICRPELFREVQEGLRSVALAFDKAAAFDESVKTSDLARVASAIADLPRVLAKGQELIDAEATFMAGDWRPLPFLVRDISDRSKLARIALTHGGSPVGRERAKEWLQQWEAQLREQNGVNRLEIAY